MKKDICKPPTLISKVKLKVRMENKFEAEEIEEAFDELLDQLIIGYCPQHPKNIVVLADAENAA